MTSIHDAHGRRTPFELSLPSREFAVGHFRRIEEDAEEKGVDLRDLGSFVLLPSTGALVEELRGGGEDPELLHQYGALAFHGFHFWRAGEPYFLMETGVARYLVEAAPSPTEWEPRAPADAGYLQLPRHLFWSGPEEEGPAEALDGYFWTVGTGETISFLVAMGMRDDRPGLSVIALPPLPLRDAGAWLGEKARPEGEDFSTTLPGGSLDRLYSVLNTGEVLKLGARTFWYLDRFPEVVGPEERWAGREAESDPRGSSLPFRKIRLAPEPEGGSEGRAEGGSDAGDEREDEA